MTDPFREKSLRREIAALKGRLMAIERELKGGPRRILGDYGRDGKRKNVLIFEGPASRNHPITLRKEAERAEICASIEKAQKALPPRAKPRLVIQDRNRPPHGHTASSRPKVVSGRRSCPADNLKIARMWREDSLEEVTLPLIREESPQDRAREVEHSALRPLSLPSKGKHALPRKPFEKIRRKIVVATEERSCMTKGCGCGGVRHEEKVVD